MQLLKIQFTHHVLKYAEQSFKIFSMYFLSIQLELFVNANMLGIALSASKVGDIS